MAPNVFPTPSLYSLTRKLDSVEKTLSFGERLSHALMGGDVLALTGDLGVGKTLITRGIALGFGIQDGQVSSPTFSLIQVYENHVPIIHVDLYRLESSVAIGQLGLEDYFTPKNIVIIEWADRFIQALPSDYLEIHLEHGDTEITRQMTLRATGPRGLGILSAIRNQG